MAEIFMVSLTVSCPDNETLVRAAEALGRTQIGLALEGLYTSMSISTVVEEEVVQETYIEDPNEG